MSKEIERKFLVNQKQLPALFDPDYITQGYLHSDENMSIRVRVNSDGYNINGTLTIKSRRVGLSCDEYEYEIHPDDAQEMLDKMCDKTISKERYYIKHDSHMWEIDVFQGDNDGLVVAEIELSTEGEKFPFPDWVDTEISDDPKYLNVNLLENPYKNW
jgi:adenylate cyclase